MTSNISRLNTDTSTSTRAGGDRLRIALADAIQGAAKTRANFERHRAGIERTRDAVTMNEAQLEKATAAISKAQESHIAQLMHHAAAGSVAGPSKVKIAKEAAADIEDELAAQREALAKLKSDLPLWEKEVALADGDVERAISAILAPMAEKLIERGREIASQLAPIRSALNALWFEPRPAGHDDSFAFEQARRPLAETKEAVADFLRSTTAIGRVENPWAAARDRLRADSTAKLPELEALLSGELSE